MTALTPQRDMLVPVSLVEDAAEALESAGYSAIPDQLRALSKRSASVVAEELERELEYRVRTAVDRWKAADYDGRDADAAVAGEIRGGRVAVRALLHVGENQ